MATHIKPTKEELEANLQKSTEELEALENKKKEGEVKDEKGNEQKPNKKNDGDGGDDADGGKKDDDGGGQDDDGGEKDKEDAGKEAPIDYKKKFTESTREAQVLASKNKKVAEAIEKASELPEPTDDELAKEHSADWETMSDLEKRLAKESLMNRRRFEAINEATRAFKDIDAWTGKVDEYLTDPKTLVTHSELEGREEEFKVFVTKPSRRGVDFDDLVSAFLYEFKKNAPAPKKGKMFEPGSGGPNDKGKKSDMLSLEEGRALRKSDYNEWKRQNAAGKIQSDI